MTNFESEIKSSELFCFFKDAEEQLAEYSITEKYHRNDNKHKLFGFIKESGRRIVIHKKPFNIFDKSAASKLIAFARCLQEGVILADDMFLSLEENEIFLYIIDLRKEESYRGDFQLLSVLLLSGRLQKLQKIQIFRNILKCIATVQSLLGEAYCILHPKRIWIHNSTQTFLGRFKITSNTYDNQTKPTKSIDLYLAPEVAFEDTQSYQKFNYQQDSWSIGQLFIELFVDYIPLKQIITSTDSKDLVYFRFQDSLSEYIKFLKKKQLSMEITKLDSQQLIEQAWLILEGQILCGTITENLSNRLGIDSITEVVEQFYAENIEQDKGQQFLLLHNPHEQKRYYENDNMKQIGMENLWYIEKFEKENKNCQLNMTVDILIPLSFLEQFCGNKSKRWFIVAEMKFTYDQDVIGFQTTIKDSRIQSENKNNHLQFYHLFYLKFNYLKLSAASKLPFLINLFLKDTQNEEFTISLGKTQINLSVLFLNNPDAKQQLTKTISAEFELENDAILKVSSQLNFFHNKE